MDSASTRVGGILRGSECVPVNEQCLRVCLLKIAHGLNTRFHLRFQVMALVNHISDVGFRVRIEFCGDQFGINQEEFLWIDRTHR